jgi:hypothetical protein
MSTDKWLLVVHGDKNRFEVSAVRESNKHGQKSWGWDDSGRKIILAENRTPTTLNFFNKLVMLAEKEVEELNK